MLRELTHFVRNSPEVLRLQKRLSRAEFLDTLNVRVDAQGYADVRRGLVGDLSGPVLEVGCGTGSMFGYYGPGARVEAIEPEQDFLELALAKASQSGGQVRAAAGDGMRLDFPDASFDAVVLCLVLCSVPSVERVLSEALRVLRPGGALRALEHVRSDGLVGGALMTAVNPLWLALNKQDCNLNRNPLPQIEAAGFRVSNVESFQRFDTMLPAFPMKRIEAKRPG